MINIAIIEDDSLVRHTLTALFEQQDNMLCMLAVQSAEGFLKKAPEIPCPDIVLSDIGLPGMDGIELCRVVRERADTQNTPVLILSARGDAESIMRGIEAGANDYLPKPILHHDLVAKVRVMLEQVDGAA
jgi:DNA-binding response OmpR family regulator